MCRTFVLIALIATCNVQSQAGKFVVQQPKYQPVIFQPASISQKISWAKQWGITGKLVLTPKPTFVRFDARSSYNAALDAGIGGTDIGWFSNANSIFLEPPIDTYVGTTVVPGPGYKTFFLRGTKLSPSKTYLVLMHLQILKPGTVKISNGVTEMDWPLQSGPQTIPVVLPTGQTTAAATLNNSRSGVMGWVQDATLEVISG